jgi:hypothetical protein
MNCETTGYASCPVICPLMSYLPTSSPKYSTPEWHRPLVGLVVRNAGKNGRRHHKKLQSCETTKQAKMGKAETAASRKRDKDRDKDDRA